MTDKIYDPHKIVLTILGHEIKVSDEPLQIKQGPFKKWDIAAIGENTTTLTLFVKEHFGNSACAWATMTFNDDSDQLKMILDTDPYEFEGLTMTLKGEGNEL